MENTKYRKKNTKCNIKNFYSRNRSETGDALSPVLFILALEMGDSKDNTGQ